MAHFPKKMRRQASQAPPGHSAARGLQGVLLSEAPLLLGTELAPEGLLSRPRRRRAFGGRCPQEQGFPPPRTSSGRTAEPGSPQDRPELFPPGTERRREAIGTFILKNTDYILARPAYLTE